MPYNRTHMATVGVKGLSVCFSPSLIDNQLRYRDLSWY